MATHNLAVNTRTTAARLVLIGVCACVTVHCTPTSADDAADDDLGAPSKKRKSASDGGSPNGTNPSASNGADGAEAGVVTPSNETNLEVTTPTTINSIASAVSGASGSSTLTLNSPTAAPLFAPGQIIIVHQSLGGGAGNWERHSIAAVDNGTVTLSTPLAQTYSSEGSDRAQAVVVPEYTNVTESGGAFITAPPWDGNTGGILALIASSSTTINDSNGITMAAKGYAGGISNTWDEGSNGFMTIPSVNGFKMPGGSYLWLDFGIQTTLSTPNHGGGGGGGKRRGCIGSGGGGGGHASLGTSGATGVTGTRAISGGAGGETYGDAALSQIFFGSGGGAGGYSDDPAMAHGGAGGGIVILYTHSIDLRAPKAINVDGAAGTIGQGNGDGGGGAGGSIFITHTSTVTGYMNLSANGGAGSEGNGGGGNGGNGRVVITP